MTTQTALATGVSILAVATAMLTSAATARAAISSNWSGYAATGTAFSAVTGTWVQPTADCTSATSPTTASAFWVGLGGDTGSSALEQIGSEADCTGGAVSYSAWYELVPKAAVKIALKVSAGDKLAATVRVNGTKVTLTISNQSTGTRFTRTLTMASPDISSAEWIAEAPSVLTPGGTQVLPLTDFGTIRFSSATATSASGRTGTISDQAWSAARILLESQSGGPGPYGRFASESIGVVQAVPTGLSNGGGAFAVTWKQTGSAPPPNV